MSKRDEINMEDFAHQLRLSVDSRIQLAEHQLSKIIMPFMPDNKQSHQPDFNSKASIPTFNSPKLYNEKLFNLIEDYTNRVCKLIYIRSKINKHNAIEVNNIIETEVYLQWDRKTLNAFMNDTLNQSISKDSGQ